MRKILIQWLSQDFRRQRGRAIRVEACDEDRLSRSFRNGEGCIPNLKKRRFPILPTLAHNVTGSIVAKREIDSEIKSIRASRLQPERIPGGIQFHKGNISG